MDDSTLPKAFSVGSDHQHTLSPLGFFCNSAQCCLLVIELILSLFHPVSILMQKA
jgi:hypothetical protein